MTHRRRRRRRLPGAPPPRTAALRQHVEALGRQPNRDHRVRVTAGAAVAAIAAAATAAASQPDRVLDGEAAVPGGAPSVQYQRSSIMPRSLLLDSRLSHATRKLPVQRAQPARRLRRHR